MIVITSTQLVISMFFIIAILFILLFPFVFKKQYLEQREKQSFFETERERLKKELEEKVFKRVSLKVKLESFNNSKGF